jgi:hypothetical protein
MALNRLQIAQNRFIAYPGLIVMRKHWRKTIAVRILTSQNLYLSVKPFENAVWSFYA